MALNAKRVIAVLVALAGLVLTGGGLWLATQLGTSGSASFTMTPTRNGAVVVTPDVLNRLDGDFVVRAESAKSDGAVWMGEVAPSDADLIVGETGATRLTGFSVRDGWVLRHKLVGAGENPDFAAADIWRATISGKGSQTIVVDQASAPDAVIIAAEDGRVGPVSITVERKAWFVQAIITAVVGLALVLAGILLWRSRLGSPRPTASKRASAEGPAGGSDSSGDSQDAGAAKTTPDVPTPDDSEAAPPSTGRRLRVGGAVLLTAATLAGCSPTESIAGIHAPPAENMKVAPLSADAAADIAVRVTQEAGMAATMAVDDAGNAARDAVLVGSASELMKARLAVSGATTASAGLTKSDAPKVLAISQGKTFPRALLATTLDTSENRQYLESFLSSEVTTPFRLENRVPMLPGATLPALPSLAAGTQLVGADDGDGLVMSPKAALEAYAGALAYPSPVANDSVETSDSFATLLQSNQTKQAEGLGSLASYAVTQTSVPEAIRAFRLADGSVVVFGRIDRSDVMTAGENTKELTVPEAYQKLVGTATATTSVTINSMQPVVLLVPADGKGKVKLLGVIEQLASGSSS